MTKHIRQPAALALAVVLAVPALAVAQSVLQPGVVVQPVETGTQVPATIAPPVGTVAPPSTGTMAPLTTGVQPVAAPDIGVSTIGSTAGAISTGATTSFQPSALVLIKTAALDQNCDGAADGGFTTTSVQPGNGQCVLWRLEVRNAGSEILCNVRLDDRAPSDVAQISIQPFIQSQPRPGLGQCRGSGDGFSCTLGNSLDANGDGVSESNCMRPQETAEVRYGILIK